jgi:hypothetical protein
MGLLFHLAGWSWQLADLPPSVQPILASNSFDVLGKANAMCDNS